MNGRRGFTLIELLMAVAIIAIVGAIVLPALALARRNAAAAQAVPQLPPTIVVEESVGLPYGPGSILRLCDRSTGNLVYFARGGWDSGALAVVPGGCEKR